MLNSRFLWQLWALLGGLVMVSTIVFGWITAQQLENDVRSTLRDSLQTQANMLQQFAIPLLQQNQIATEAQVEQLTSGIDHRVTLINMQGKVLADNRESALVMEDHGSRPEIIAAQASGVGISERYSQTVKQNMLYVALRIDQQPSGYIRLAMPLEIIQTQLSELRSRIFLSAFLITIVFLIIGFLLARRVTRPLVEITDTAEQIATGHYGLRLPASQKGEIGKLSAAMNELASETETRIQDLTSSRNQLATILAGLTEGVIAVDMDSTILHINEAAQKMLSVDGLYSQASQLRDLPQAAELTQSTESCLQERISLHISIKVDEHNIDVLIAPLNGLDNQVIGAIIVLQDITEMLHLEKVRSDFVANASHELKTPISAIRGLVETIVDDPSMDKSVLTRFLGRIKNQAIRLDTIVQDLIRLSRFDAQETIGRDSNVNLSEIVKAVYEAKLEDAADSEVDLMLDVPSDPIVIQGESEALDQMVSNLVDNAIKYCGDDGKVELRLSRRGQMARIEVEDNGIGIPKEDQQRIFERFYRVDRGRSREQGGTGLGLAIVKHVVGSHHGEVTVRSGLDKGTVFEVSIPSKALPD